MRKEDIEGSDKWLNDPGEPSEDDLETITDVDFEMWMRMGVKPESIVDFDTRSQYETYIRTEG